MEKSMRIRIIYEKDFKTREKLIKWFESKNCDVIACYSLAKLNLIKSQNPDKEFIIFTRDSENDLKAIESEFSHIILLDGLNPLNGLENHISNKNSISLFAEKNNTNLFDIICIGSSTGGFPIVQQIVKGINQKDTIIIICQHINKLHSNDMFMTLSKQVRRNLKHVDSSTELKKGNTYLLSGASDFEIKSKYKKLYLEPVGITNEPYHPSFNILTGSLSKLNGAKLGCIILSGLGDDGSKHLKELKNNHVEILV